MSISLRPSIASDYETIASWVSDETVCARWAGPNLRFPFQAAELPELLIISGAVSHTLCQGASNVIGFCQFWVREFGAVHIGRIIVSPKFRGQGYGKKLCCLLIEEALNETAANEITLRVYRDNPSALKVYSSLGFMPVEAESTNEMIFMQASANPSIQRTF